jgi:hypothetical protein
MDAQALKRLQAPLKERYRAEPESALVTLRATGELTEGISCSVDTGRAIAEAGLHPHVPESRFARSPRRSVSTFAGGTVRVEGDLDFRGTLGVDKEAPVGFTDIRVGIDVDTDATAEQLATLERLTHRYCVIYQSLAQPPTLGLSVASAAIGS